MTNRLQDADWIVKYGFSMDVYLTQKYSQKREAIE
jgi:hypothetical protein